MANYPTRLYVDPARPSDTGNGMSEGTAKRTIQAAVGAAPQDSIINLMPGAHNQDSWPVTTGTKRIAFNGLPGPSARASGGTERARVGSSSGSVQRYFEIQQPGTQVSMYGHKIDHIDFDPRGLAPNGECVYWTNVNFGQMTNCRAFDPNDSPTAHVNKWLLRGNLDVADLSWCTIEQNQVRGMRLVQLVDNTSQSLNTCRVMYNTGTHPGSGPSSGVGPMVELILGSAVAGQASRGHGDFVLHNYMERVSSGPLYRIRGGRPFYFAFNDGDQDSGVFAEFDSVRNAIVISSAGHAGTLVTRSNQGQSFVTVPNGLWRDTVNNNMYLNNHYPALDNVQAGGPNFVSF